MKKFTICLLDFFQTTTQMVGLCMSVYGLPFNLNKPWSYQHYIIVTCCFLSILTTSIKDALSRQELLTLQKKYVVREDTVPLEDGLTTANCLGRQM